MIKVLTSDLSIGLMFAVFGYLWYMMGPVQEVLNIQYAYYSARASLNRLNKIFALEQEAVIEAKADPFKDKQTVSVRLENICFKYPEKDESINQEDADSVPIIEDESCSADTKYILKNLSLSINEGETLALVGSK